MASLKKGLDQLICDTAAGNIELGEARVIGESLLRAAKRVTPNKAFKVLSKTENIDFVVICRQHAELGFTANFGFAEKHPNVEALKKLRSVIDAVITQAPGVASHEC